MSIDRARSKRIVFDFIGLTTMLEPIRVSFLKDKTILQRTSYNEDRLLIFVSYLQSGARSSRAHTTITPFILTEDVIPIGQFVDVCSI